VKVGDLVRIRYQEMNYSNEIDSIGIIIDFCIVYNRYGDPTEKFAVVNWGSKFPYENEYMEHLEVINENKN